MITNINMIKKSIVFYLNNQLEVYELDYVKESIELLALEKSEKRLQLFETFEGVWLEIWEKIKKTSEIYFVLGDQAGFTNTRIVYLWLKSLSEFGLSIELKIVKNSNFVDLQNQPFSLIKSILQSATKQDLLYSQETRIGQKIN
jgi:hypothetical protein